MTEYLLGMDAGSTAYKAAVFDLAGHEIGLASRQLPPHRMPHPGWVERPLDTAWPAMCTVIREAITRSGVDARDIAAIGSTGHGNGLYVLDKDGGPVRDAISSLDTRAEAVTSGWQEDARLIRSLTNQALWPGQPNALLAWIRANEPDEFAAIRAVLMVTDYLNYRLTGVRASSVSMMSGTSLMNVFANNYDASLLDRYGLTNLSAALPPLVESQDVVGYVSAEAAHDTGLLAGTPVVAGAFDIDASAIGAGVIAPDQACVIAGTWSINEAVSDHPIRDPSLLMSKRFAVPGLWLNVDASPTSTANLDWFRAQFLEAERRDAEEAGRTIFDVCDELVSSVEEASANVVFHPFLFGSDVQPSARAGFYGVAAWHSKAHLLHALYEGVAFGHRVHIDRLRTAGARVGSVRMAGGGSRSRVWAQMFADVLDAEVEVPAGTEVGALGAAMVAGVGVGLYPNMAAAVASAVSVHASYRPRPIAREMVASRYGVYRELVEALSGPWDRLASLAPVNRS